jgi:hypothetical protein
MVRSIAASLLAATAALASPARAGAPSPFFGVHVVQADLLPCDGVSVDGLITFDANIPDDGRVWSWAWFSEASDGTNLASVSDGPFGLAPTVGDVLLQNLGSLLVGPSAPGALGVPFDLTYAVHTYADGVLVLESTITATCNGAEVSASAFESRLAPPQCGPPLEGCDVLELPAATLRIKDGGPNHDFDKARVSLTASGVPSDLDHFQDPTLAPEDGGATTATCFYDSADGLILGLGADAAVETASDKPRWKRSATTTKVVQKYRDPAGEEGPLRSLVQTSGAKAKIALAARGMPVTAASFTANGLRIQQRTVAPRDRVFTCTEVHFPDGSIDVDPAKGTVKAKIKVPACGPGCP